jgi:hypothetical protein
LPSGAPDSSHQEDELENEKCFRSSFRYGRRRSGPVGLRVEPFTGRYAFPDASAARIDAIAYSMAAFHHWRDHE